MNKILLENMMFYGFHGVHEYEREQGQRFYVDVEMTADLSKAGQTDDLNDTIDYTVVYDSVKDIMENHRFQLLEALGTHIAEDIVTMPLIDEVTIRIRKPAVPIHGQLEYVQVETTRKKQA